MDDPRRDFGTGCALGCQLHFFPVHPGKERLDRKHQVVFRNPILIKASETLGAMRLSDTSLSTADPALFTVFEHCLYLQSPCSWVNFLLLIDKARLLPNA